ncbi:inner membrane transport permease YadH [Escherichia coli]|uniref:Inner membrane transport permease YadH n=1 Tax=Escherichia coli TaxID=562 RepID=A0A377KCF2_ECOLX|nr:inner membrane transport permease YadH [Escherichia coli]
MFYSLTLLPPFWQGLSHLNPIVYMISGFRYGFLGINDVPLVTTFGVLVVFIVAFLFNLLVADPTWTWFA